MIDSGWSSRLEPMPGMSLTMGIPKLYSWERGPIPECRRRRGVSTAPAQRMVSFFGFTVKLLPDCRVRSTPVTVESLTLTRLTQVFVRMVRLDRCSSPRRIGCM